MRGVTVGCAFVVVLGLASGAIYERVGERRDMARLPRIGESVNIGGRSVNVYCVGSGSPTVILDSGGSEPGYSNSALQRLFARETRTCWFDRAGLGWSDPSPKVQTSAAIAADLHDALHAAKIMPPYILVGKSFSGFNVRLFAKSFPSEVAGIVLMDSVQEDQRLYEPRSTLAPFNRLPKAVRGRFALGSYFLFRRGRRRVRETFGSGFVFWRARASGVGSVRDLAFSGLAVSASGELSSVTRVETLIEAQRRADELRADLTRRGVHHDVLRFCRAELVTDNYFHAVLEAAKSIDKLRTKSGLTEDGAKLVDASLCGSAPRVAIVRGISRD